MGFPRGALCLEFDSQKFDTVPRPCIVLLPLGCAISGEQEGSSDPGAFSFWLRTVVFVAGGSPDRRLRLVLIDVRLTTVFT